MAKIAPEVRLLYYLGLSVTKNYRELGCGGADDIEAMEIYIRYGHDYRFRRRRITRSSSTEMMQIMIQDLIKKKKVESNEVG